MPRTATAASSYRPSSSSGRSVSRGVRSVRCRNGQGSIGGWVVFGARGTAATLRLPSGIVRAISLTQYGGPEVLTLTEQPDPTPGAGEVLIDIAATSVNRADLLQRQGRYHAPPGT